MAAQATEARSVHSFRNGPFDGRTYSHWKACPLDEGRTALALFPYGVDIGPAIAWGMADFRYSEGGYASVVGKVAVYRQADSRVWEYVPPAPMPGGYHKGR
jgi:hypothetical protein